MRSAATAAGLAVFAAACLGGASRPREDAGAAARRALPLLQHTMDEWFEERTCTSCHHHSLPVIALAFAAERGLPVDHVRLADQVARLANPPDGLADALQLRSGINPAIGRGYQLAALGAVAHAADDRTDAMAHVLAALPAPEGRFPSTSHRSPHEDSDISATALASRGLLLYGPPGRKPEIDGIIAAARRWLLRVRPQNAEDRAMRLFGLRWTAADEADLVLARQELLATQNDDGGFAQLDGDPSDAYATALCLVALQQAGDLPAADPAYRRGVAWLLQQQHGDGSWRVSTRRRAPGLEHFETGFPHGENQFISCAATAWAVIALAATIDEGPSRALRGGPPRRSGRATALSPLLAAAAFGTAEELEQRLAAGADPDEVGPGGVTALALAVHDERKVLALLRAGARADVRSDRGATPLLLAAAAARPATIRVLLAAGADANAADQDGMTPLFFGVLVGDQDKVRLLLGGGADPTVRTPLGGLVHVAAWIDDSRMIRLIAGAGVDVDMRTGDPDRSTALHHAAVDGLTAAVQTLLQCGAEVDAGDGEGMTALAWAARVRRGHGRIAAALLAAGADPDRPCADGTTPRDWARREGNEAVLRLLR